MCESFDFHTCQSSHTSSSKEFSAGNSSRQRSALVREIDATTRQRGSRWTHQGRGSVESQLRLNRSPMRAGNKVWTGAGARACAEEYEGRRESQWERFLPASSSRKWKSKTPKSKTAFRTVLDWFWRRRVPPFRRSGRVTAASYVTLPSLEYVDPLDSDRP